MGHMSGLELAFKNILAVGVIPLELRQYMLVLIDPPSSQIIRDQQPELHYGRNLELSKKKKVGKEIHGGGFAEIVCAYLCTPSILHPYSIAVGIEY